MVIEIACSFTAALVWGWVSRMCGGGKPHIGKIPENMFYALPHGILGYVALGWWGIPLAFGFAWLGKATGHGQYFDLGTSPVDQPEKMDFIVRWIMGPDRKPSELRDYVGMCVSGMLIALGSVIALGIGGHILFAALVLCGGAFKGAAYEIGKLAAKPTGIRYNEIGEYLTGFADIFAVSLAAWGMWHG